MYTQFPHTCVLNPAAKLHAKISAEEKQLVIADENIPVNKVVEKVVLKNFKEQPESTLPKTRLFGDGLLKYHQDHLCNCFRYIPS